MEIIYHFIIVFEMVFVNLYTLNLCSRPKRRPWIIVFVYTLFSIVFISAMFFLLTKLPNYGDGNGLFVLSGILYLVPTVFLYQQSLRYTVSVFCSAWIYTMTAFFLAVRFAYLLPPEYFDAAAAAAQTFFYAVSLYFFLRFVKGKFLYILRNVKEEMLNSLVLVSCLWFLILVLLNFVMTVQASAMVGLLLAALVSFSIVISYRLFYSLVYSDQNAEIFKQKSLIDSTTKLKNRLCFLNDTKNRIQAGKPFCCVFLDLDDFKRINDTYGHCGGDAYLLGFASLAKKSIGSLSSIYRVAGDEFVVLCNESYLPQIMQRLEQINQTPSILFEGAPIEFLGVSYGSSCYPHDAEEIMQLIARADDAMYRHKIRRKQRQTCISQSKPK